MSDLNICSSCSTPGESLRRCSQCRCVFYCNVSCQKAHWKVHKKTCSPCAKPSRDVSTARGAKKAAAYIAELGPGGIGVAQQSLIAERSEELFAGLEGRFVVKDAENKTEILPSDRNDWACGRQCTVEWESSTRGSVKHTFNFLRPASLALEIESHNDEAHGRSLDFRVLEGGILYLLGEAHLFWSMMIHRRATGLCFPPGKGGEKWGGTWCFREIDEMMTSVMSAKSNLPAGSRIQNRSRSLAATVLVNKKLTGVTYVDVLDEERPVPITSQALPSWWKQLEEMWGGVTSRAVEHGKAPCMFHCTPTGCRAAECCAMHDDVWRRQVAAVKMRAAADRR
eukprot:835897-Prorocentrum_minimum.AAC.1